MNDEITKLRILIDGASALKELTDDDGRYVELDHVVLQSLLAAARAHLKSMEEKEGEQKSATAGGQRPSVSHWTPGVSAKSGAGTIHLWRKEGSIWYWPKCRHGRAALEQELQPVADGLSECKVCFRKPSTIQGERRSPAEEAGNSQP